MGEKWISIADAIPEEMERLREEAYGERIDPWNTDEEHDENQIIEHSEPSQAVKDLMYKVALQNEINSYQNKGRELGE